MIFRRGAGLEDRRASRRRRARSVVRSNLPALVIRSSWRTRCSISNALIREAARCGHKTAFHFMAPNPSRRAGGQCHAYPPFVLDMQTGQNLFSGPQGGAKTDVRFSTSSRHGKKHLPRPSRVLGALLVKQLSALCCGGHAPRSNLEGGTRQSARRESACRCRAPARGRGKNRSGRGIGLQNPYSWGSGQVGCAAIWACAGIGPEKRSRVTL